MACVESTVGKILSIAGITVTPANDITQDNPRNNIKMGGTTNADALTGIGRNENYLILLANQVGKLSAKYNTALGSSSKGYYNRRTGKMQSYPIFEDVGSTAEGVKRFIMLANILAHLLFYRVIEDSYKLDLFNIDEFTGEYCDNNASKTMSMLSAAFNIPPSGIITRKSKPNNINKYGFTFTAVDIKIDIIFGNTISKLEGLTGFTWSLHKDKSQVRKLASSNATSIVEGTKTIAGSLFFSVFDEDVIKANLPPEAYGASSEITMASDGMDEYETVKSVDLEPIDIFIYFSNEYGATSLMKLWGVTFTDEGGAMSTRQMENEVSLSYLAHDISPMIPIEKGPNGELDIFAWRPSAHERLHQKRIEILTNGMGVIGYHKILSNELNNIAKSIG